MDSSNPKPWYRRWWAYVIGGFIVLTAIGALASPKDSAKTAANSPSPSPSVSSKPSSKPSTVAPAGSCVGLQLTFMKVTKGCTVGLVGTGNLVSASVGSSQPAAACLIRAVAVARWNGGDGAWEPSSETPKDLAGATPQSLMATFSHAGSQYLFHADMDLAPEFTTRDFTKLNASKALVLSIDC